jgi:hypothetical protein
MIYATSNNIFIPLYTALDCSNFTGSNYYSNAALYVYHVSDNSYNQSRRGISVKYREMPISGLQSTLTKKNLMDVPLFPCWVLGCSLVFGLLPYCISSDLGIHSGSQNQF